MILSAFRSNQPALNLIFPLLCGILMAFSAEWQAIDWDWQPTLGLGWQYVIAGISICTSAWLVNKFTHYSGIFNHYNQLPGLFFVLLSLQDPNFHSLYWVHLAIAIALFGCLPTLNLNIQNPAPIQSFNAAFYVTASSIVFAPLVALLIMVIIIPALIRSANIQEFSAAIIGILSPIALLFFAMELWEFEISDVWTAVLSPNFNNVQTDIQFSSTPSITLWATAYLSLWLIFNQIVRASQKFRTGSVMLFAFMIASLTAYTANNLMELKLGGELICVPWIAILGGQSCNDPHLPKWNIILVYSMLVVLVIFPFI